MDAFSLVVVSFDFWKWLWFRFLWI